MKKPLFALLRRAGVSRLVAWGYRRRVVFVCYHSVTPWPHAFEREPELHMRLADFAEQMDYLRRRHNVVPLSEYLAARREGRRLPDYSAVITFDDGTRNFLTVAVPLLARLGLPASVFVITRHVGGQDGAARLDAWTHEDDNSCLSWEDVRRLADTPGVEVGSHSSTHPDLTLIPGEEVRRELAESLAELAARTGNPSPALAYPHGRADARARELARELGYSCALTGELGANDMGADLFALRRVVIAGDDDLSTFVARVSGVTWWSERVRAALARLRPGASGRTRPAPRHAAAQDDAGLVQMKKTSPGTIP